MTTTHKHNNKPSQKVKSKIIKIKNVDFCHLDNVRKFFLRTGKKDYPTNCWTRGRVFGKKSNILRKEIGENVAVIELTLPKLLFWSTAAQEEYPGTAAQEEYPGYFWARGVSGYFWARGPPGYCWAKVVPGPLRMD
ncbi:4236_t:CDS:2 [Funneliformis caledonium]|uniref:4236_t:CDS:1 n=1 Tax=Funneliformis caledonium TaxID=1117310 RepID=A0A9N9NMQ7_9GLOM|nr:4236_t:CDS:2 [Funneliformis caledonium]